MAHAKFKLTSHHHIVTLRFCISIAPVPFHAIGRSREKSRKTLKRYMDKLLQKIAKITKGRSRSRRLLNSERKIERSDGTSQSILIHVLAVTSARPLSTRTHTHTDVYTRTHTRRPHPRTHTNTIEIIDADYIPNMEFSKNIISQGWKDIRKNQKISY